MRNLLLFILSCTFFGVMAQKRPQSQFRFGIEYGNSQIAEKINSRWEIRQTVNDYSGDENQYRGGSAKGEGRIEHIGLKAELSLWQERLTLTSGLRFTKVKERISSKENPPYLYLYTPSNMGLEFFRVKEMTESINYLSIPLEADILLLGYLSNWQVYAKGGIQTGVKVYEDTSINFVSQEMQAYEKEILTKAGENANTFFSTVYYGLGLRLTLENDTRFSIEVISPHLFIKDNFTLLKTESYAGIRLSAVVPLNIFASK